MRILLVALSGFGFLSLPTLLTADAFDYAFELSYERSVLDGLSLGADKTRDRRVEENLEFEFALEYQVTNDFYLFFTGALVDDSEIIETAGTEEESLNGLERREMGVGYYFGDNIDSVLIVGRSEFVSASEWWPWWDEELDAIRLQSAYGDIEVLLALAEELAPENTQDNFIDPQLEDLRRSIFSLSWEFVPNHSIGFYYLDQIDRSSEYAPGELEDEDKIDAQDADLTWTGISYLGGFRSDTLGHFNIEMHAARVSGEETLYEFEDPEGGRSEVGERINRDVSGSAQGILLGWTPILVEDLTLVIGNARGDGDSNAENGRDSSFRATGLQGDSESLGELYQPELSNLNVDLLGMVWQINDDVRLAVFGYQYKQRELAEEMRDVAIELDLTGDSRDLGSEIDLILAVETGAGLELILTAAEFDPGRAYGDFKNESASYFNVEIVYQF